MARLALQGIAFLCGLLGVAGVLAVVAACSEEWPGPREIGESDPREPRRSRRIAAGTAGALLAFVAAVVSINVADDLRHSRPAEAVTAVAGFLAFAAGSLALMQRFVREPSRTTTDRRDVALCVAMLFGLSAAGARSIGHQPQKGLFPLQSLLRDPGESPPMKQALDDE